MVTPQLNGITTPDVSTVLECQYPRKAYTLDLWRDKRKPTAVTVRLQGSFKSDDSNGICNATGTGLAIGSTPERFANSAFTYRIGGTTYNKAAIAAGSTFTSNFVLAASKFAVISIFIDTAGTLISVIGTPDTNQTASYGKDTAAEAYTDADYTISQYALAQGFAINAIRVGWILIENDAVLWTGNTDDLTDASDVTTATFISAVSDFADIDIYSWDADDINAGRVSYPVLSGGWFRYIRIFASSITGTAKIYGNVYPY